MYYRTPKAIGQAIRKRRRALKMTQADLARRTGVSRQWVAAVERGKPRAELGLILRTFNVLDMPIMFGVDNWSRRSADEIDAAVEAAKVPRE